MLNIAEEAASHGGSSMLVSSGLGKAYGATVALENADITLKKGRVHALVGENGAGKSTLVRILTGAVRPDKGAIYLDGQPYVPHSVLDARRLQVATAFQELSLVSNLTVAQNLLMPRLPRGRLGLASTRLSNQAGAAILEKHGLSRVRPDVQISSLPLADRQRIEIVRAIEYAGKVLVLDEPTASLAETDWLFERIRKATAKGVAVLYISHRLAEVREVCSEATVLRNGRSIASVDLANASDNDIFEMMVGRRAHAERDAARVAPKLAEAAPRLVVDGLAGGALRNVSFELRPGEILGVAALEGQGQRDLFRMLAGLDKPAAGSIALDGRTVSLSNPRKALKSGSGIAYLPEERKVEGILAGLTAATNVALPVMPRVSRLTLISSSAEQKLARETGEKVEFNKRYLNFAISDLSGGNQQKVLIARCLATGAKTLLLFDPTRGVDVGTKQSIYAAIRAFAEEGGSVLFYSSELPEIVQLASRCMAFYGGQIFDSFEGAAINEQDIVAAMVGHRGKTEEVA
ncbi:ribose transport system ATP-binding protein [Neorhizobium galegae]|uniref:sugar ABC transporter ATP-binding protein n=1 Tax=Neorhizobium galegae TaxID=399 RepID=UPI001FD8A9E3|nr:sugar ABC transporter ATP-binding protein [Neorhizobium galegae]MBP2551107.1 ribose transport system ATP-binding protein [Neorhizobium galegae]